MVSTSPPCPLSAAGSRGASTVSGAASTVSGVATVVGAVIARGAAVQRPVVPRE